METTICPNEFLLDFSWLWFIVSVLISYGVGAMWYTFLFGKKWIKALKYECKCGARLDKGETCRCEKHSPWVMILQFFTTALVGFMYFILTPISLPLAILVCIAFAGWTKSMLNFQIAEWKRYVTLVMIDVGYFVVVSAVFILFASL